jgi:hypothetical protein
MKNFQQSKTNLVSCHDLEIHDSRKCQTLRVPQQSWGFTYDSTPPLSSTLHQLEKCFSSTHPMLTWICGTHTHLVDTHIQRRFTWQIGQRIEVRLAKNSTQFVINQAGSRIFKRTSERTNRTSNEKVRRRNNCKPVQTILRLWSLKLWLKQTPNVRNAPEAQ